MDKKYLPDLISELDQELLRLGYTKGSMTFYRRRWNQLMAYAEDRGEYYYTEQLGIDSVQESSASLRMISQGYCPRQRRRNYASSAW